VELDGVEPSVKRVVVLTSVPQGFASVCLPLLHASPGLELAGVILSRNELTPEQRRRYRRKQLRKVMAIGPLGAVNGVRMRRWFGEDVNAILDVRDVETLCADLGIPLTRVPCVNHPETSDALRALAPDVGLSLGNAYIGSKIFTLPRLGMVNIHHEVLPDFRGAHSVLWQLYHGSTQTGYTIHMIDKGLDTGAILAQEVLPVIFRPTLAETVATTVAELFRRSAAHLPRVVADLEDRLADAGPQGPGRHFTTPTYRQFRRMARNFRRLAAQNGPQPARSGPL
jgi:methionyl-tRNA formyltransferase